MIHRSKSKLFSIFAQFLKRHTKITMTIQILILAAGLLMILFGANYLVDGSSSIARKSGLSEFFIGLTIVGIGTSTPEMVVSFMSSLQGKADMAIGNIIGSNIFNTLTILGATALICPLTITRSNIRKDIPMNIIVSILLILLGCNHTIFGIGQNSLSRIDGTVFLLIFLLYMISSFRSDDQQDQDEEKNDEKTFSTSISLLMITGGLAFLIIGGRFFVNSASAIAEMCGVSDKFIAITVMAGGTSLPELATCIVAAIKGKGQLALGNILGSNISNILLILGGSALISPLPFSGMTNIDLGTVLASSVFILLSTCLFRRKTLDRIEGVILLLMYFAYMGYLIMTL